MATASALLALAAASFIALIDLHRAATGAWWLKHAWGWTLLLTDAGLSMAGAHAAAVLARLVSVDEALVASIGLVAGLAGVSALRWVPLPRLRPGPKGQSPEEPALRARQYVLDRVQEHALASSNRWLIDHVLPAAKLIGVDMLGEIAALLVQQRIRRGLETENTLSLIAAIQGDSCSCDVKIKSLLRVLLDNGGTPICRELLHRAKPLQTSHAALETAEGS